MAGTVPIFNISGKRWHSGWSPLGLNATLVSPNKVLM
eukprot:CAMPEP_0178769132 /NCGR_PEP_ID=MMETSP0744-20121128/20651_1 /TAXON_ID=913974 /ORGANISM="Nitzschia punctata, Strain CCMP561" /LENGTH=36 /DNA_ID= /DNA_START= /DNA_END= /DNA_ORIENTATION=